MTRDIDRVAADFDLLVASDFDSANPNASGWDRLRKLCDELLAIDQPAICAQVAFRTMERLDGVDLGTPGPLVHTLETWGGSYEAFLVESVRRKPTSLSVWMVNRILNATPKDESAWLELLRSVADHPLASRLTKHEAQGFLGYQKRRHD